ncbi:comF family protein [Selenomonas ruminantium]|uniref:ComF family protein n=1 Tax=Selenomonas ruminantium TaxID=971 RepID=A0A1M6RQX9_SELRU|nr:ComF family protein [Selenomonas ruminantium]SHK34866.1 comF family protein [Selenomonas ruminantium]
MVKLLADLLDFLFPPRCPLCHAYVDGQGGWCPACLQRALQFHRLPLSVPMQAALTDAWALGVYRGSLRDLIRHLKYQKKRSNLPYIETFLQATVNMPQMQELLAAIDLAVAVPLFPAKEKERGFNQTELIFSSFLARQHIPLTRCLLRIRPTRPMYELNEKERMANLRGAFAVADTAQVTGKNILLLDDIFTSGATAGECARVLKKAGAKAVYVLVMASDHR